MYNQQDSPQLHYRRKKCRNKIGKKELIMEMIAQCEMTDEIVRQLEVSASYVDRLRWETGPTLLSRSSNEDEPESRSLNIELIGEAKARYKAVRQYRELCRKHGIEWTVSGFHTYIRTLEKKRNCERKRRRKKNAIGI